MPDDATTAEAADERAIRRQIEDLLVQWLGLSLAEGDRAELVEQVLRERRGDLSLDVEALARRVRAEVEAELQHRTPAPDDEAAPTPETGREFVRFNLSQRLQHIVLFSSCIVLIVTGLPIKFHNSAWAAFAIELMGGVEGSSLVHRIGAVGLIGVAVYHFFYVMLTATGRWNFGNLIWDLKDMRDLAQMLRYFVGRSQERPRFGRYSYVEKFDYWAVYWGIVIMVGSGCLLWFETITLSVFPKYVLDIAKEAHSDEALLATLAIIIWHFYNVHFNPRKFPMNKVWLTGKMSEEEMIEEHPLEYEEVLREEERRRGGS